MWQLNRPMINLADILARCRASINDHAFAERLGVITPSLQNSASAYVDLAIEGQLFSLPTENTVDGVVSGQEMEWLYTSKFSKKASPVRPFYDLIMAANRNGICPLCGQRVASTLDHYLAKSLHPAFSVTPDNLIPACKDCNHEKLNHQPQNGNEQTLHPYFDDIDNGVWLYAEVVQGKPPALRFFVAPPIAWNAVKARRVEYHFHAFKLATLYATHAAVELSQIEYSLQRLAERGGAEAIRSHLQDQVESRRHINQNNWQAATYSALSSSAWFCEEGYRYLR